MLAHAGAADESLSVVLLFVGLWAGWVGWSRLKSRGFPRLPAAGAVALVGVGIAFAISAAIVPRMLFPATNPVTLPSTPSGPRPASTATLSFDRPEDGAVETGDRLEVVLNLEGGRIVEAASTDLTPDTGHVHLVLDGKLISMTYGLVQEVDLSSLHPGEHTLVAEFVAADHGPFSPRLTSTVHFTTGDAS
jgi:hypothetical protein